MYTINRFKTTTILLMLTANSLISPLLSEEAPEGPNGPTPPPAQLIERIRACDLTLKACDDAVQAGQKVIEAKTNVIMVQGTQIQELVKQNVELKEDRDSILNSPLLWFGIGLIIGGATYGVIQHVH